MKKKVVVEVVETIHCCHVLTTKAYLLVPKVECRVQCNYVLDVMHLSMEGHQGDWVHCPSVDYDPEVA